MKSNSITYKIVALLLLINSNAFGQIKDSVKVNNWNKLCLEKRYSDIQESKSCGFKALNLAKKIDFKSGLAIAYNRIGVVYDIMNDYDSAIYYYKLGAKLSHEISNKKGEGGAYCNMGLAYLNKNNYIDALNSFHQAIKPLEEIKQYDYLGSCYNNLGLLFFDFKNLKKTRENYLLAIKYYELANNENEKANVLANLGILYSYNNLKDSSIKTTQLAIKIFTKNNDFFNLGKAYNNLGQYLLDVNKKNEAKNCFLKSIEYAKKEENISGLADTYIGLAEIYLILNQKKEANQSIENAFRLIGKIESPKIKSAVYYRYAKMQLENKNYKLAAINLFIHSQLKDSQFIAESGDKIAKAEAQFGLEKKEIVNKQLEQQNEIKDLQLKTSKIELKNKNFLIYGTIIFATLLAISLLLYFKRRQFLLIIKAEKEIQKAEEVQRLKISNDLHDNVGAQLSYIVSNLDIMQNYAQNNGRLTAIANMSKQAILTLRETVWALNNESITTEAFADKFKQYALKMMEFNGNIKINFIEDFTKNEILLPIQALNIFRICQEAFSNSLKHAQASEIDINFSDNIKSLFIFSIKDNGVGFEEHEASEKGHYGLKNMEARAKEVGAIFSLKSHKNEGTLMTIILKK